VKKIGCLGWDGFYWGVSCVSSSGCIPAVLLGATATTVGVSTAGSNLSTGTQVDDSTLRIRVINAFNAYPDLASTSNIEVTTFDHIVLLLGQVPDDTVRQQVSTAAANVKGVELVYNQLTVGPRASYGDYAKDTWITSLVKANMVGKVNPLHFKVITEDGVVYLLGVTTAEEGKKAAEVASQTRGVQQVVTAYSYILPGTASQAASTSALSMGPATQAPPTQSLNSTSEPF